MRIEGVYHYRLAGTVIGREIFSFRDEEDGACRYNADVLRNDWRTELECHVRPDGEFERISIRRSGDGVQVSGYYEREEDMVHLHLTSRSLQGRTLFPPARWEPGTFFHGHAVSLMRVLARRHPGPDAPTFEFPVFTIPRSDLFLEGRHEHGWMRLENMADLVSIGAQVGCRVFSAKFSRIKGWPFTHRMYFDESGLCRLMTGAAMRYELDELNTTGALTPLPIREGGAGTAR